MKTNKIVTGVIGTLLGLLFIAPFYIILTNSFKTKKELFLNTLSLPKGLNFDNYIKAWKELDFIKVFFNSFLITFISIVLIIIFASMAAWMIQRTNNKIANLILYMFIAAMLIPFQSVMLPLVRLMGNLHLLNIPGIIFMYLGFGSSLSIFLYHGFIKSIPRSLDEAATIDGCNSLQTYIYVIFPILKPISITVALLNMVWIWNDYLLPSLTINNEATHTIPLRIFYFFGQYTKQWHLALAGLTLSIIPVIIFYFFAQKQIIESVTAGSVKS